MPVAVNTSGRVYDDFVRLLSLHVHREDSASESDQFSCVHRIFPENYQFRELPSSFRDSLFNALRFFLVPFLKRSGTIEEPFVETLAVD